MQQQQPQDGAHVVRENIRPEFHENLAFVFVVVIPRAALAVLYLGISAVVKVTSVLNVKGDRPVSTWKVDQTDAASQF